MSEETQQPQFVIEKIYLKDLSLEIPNAPQVFLEREQPTVEIQLQTTGNPVSEGVYDVSLTITTTAKLKDKTMFLVEASQAGIFRIIGVPADEVEPILGIACPNILFPYVREAISSIVNKAGFPPVILSPVNFEALYQQRVETLAKQQASPGIITH